MKDDKHDNERAECIAEKINKSWNALRHESTPAQKAQFTLKEKYYSKLIAENPNLAARLLVMYECGEQLGTEENWPD